MLLKNVVLGLSTCAWAMNARSYSADISQNLEASSKTPLGISSISSYPALYTPQPTTRDPVLAPYPIKSNGTSTSSAPSSTGTSASCVPYWLESIKHQGIASFNPNPDNYTIFRNVKDFGARGDGLTDDTVAIQRAVTQGNRCGPSQCESSTNTPAVVYFPEGTYLISSSIIDYYYTQVCCFERRRRVSMLTSAARW